MSLWDLLTGRGFGETAAREPLTLYHGSHRQFPAFDRSYIRTGQGTGGEGHGFYFAENPEIAKGYAAEGARLLHWKDAQTKETVYKAHINAHPNSFLDLDAPLAKQPAAVHELMRRERFRPNPNYLGRGRQSYSVGMLGKPFGRIPWSSGLLNQIGAGIPWSIIRKTNRDHTPTLLPSGPGAQFLEHMAIKYGERVASQMMYLAGIPGTRYFDREARPHQRGTRNYVVFDDKLIKLLQQHDSARDQPPPLGWWRSGDPAQADPLFRALLERK